MADTGMLVAMSFLPRKQSPIGWSNKRLSFSSLFLSLSRQQNGDFQTNGETPRDPFWSVLNVGAYSNVAITTVSLSYQGAADGDAPHQSLFVFFSFLSLSLSPFPSPSRPCFFPFFSRLSDFRVLISVPCSMMYTTGGPDVVSTSQDLTGTCPGLVYNLIFLLGNIAQPNGIACPITVSAGGESSLSHQLSHFPETNDLQLIVLRRVLLFDLPPSLLPFLSLSSSSADFSQTYADVCPYDVEDNCFPSGDGLWQYFYAPGITFPSGGDHSVSVVFDCSSVSGSTTSNQYLLDDVSVQLVQS